MPKLIRTQEDIFRAEKKDVYAIYSQQQRSWKNMMKKWLMENLPGTQMEIMGPSEHSGWINGGPIALRVDFSVEGLKLFTTRWEDSYGKSIDPRFQCYVHLYDEWYRKHGRFVPTRARPRCPGKTVWWYTPKGFIHHQLSSEDELSLDEEERKSWKHPAHPRTLWMHAVERWPKKFGALDMDNLTHGSIVWDEQRNIWRVFCDKPFLWWQMRGKNGMSVPTSGRIMKWFRLPYGTLVEEVDF